MEKKFVKFLLHEFKNDSRNLRELDTVKSLYENILIVCPKKTSNYKNNSIYKVFQFKHKISKIIFLRQIQIFYSVFIKLPILLKKQKAHTISAQDLTALGIAWLANLYSSNKAKLIYDCHDLEIDRNKIIGKNNKIKLFFIKKIENFLIKRSTINMIPASSAGNQLINLYKLKEAPLVIRNIPYKWVIDDDVCSFNRIRILKENHFSLNSFVFLYHGIIGFGRGIENLIESIKDIEGAVLLILGFGEKKYVDSIKELIKRLNCHNVAIIPAVEPNLLNEFICVADVGMITIEPITQSYYYMLPNKFFENIQALNPIICSNFPEVSNIINKYDIGLTVNPVNIEEIKNAMKLLMKDKNLYNKFKHNLIKAKNDLCWENERVLLLNEYKRKLFK